CTTINQYKTSIANATSQHIGKAHKAQKMKPTLSRVAKLHFCSSLNWAKVQNLDNQYLFDRP
ncbi:MAG: hypothetical protein ACMG51_02015, partial [Ginsengibacter sp.]